jgi:hypothetical protein
MRLRFAVFLARALSVTALTSVAAARCDRDASPLDELRRWRADSDLGRLNREDAAAVSRERRVIVVVGITGAGKSSTGNTLAGRLHKAFGVSGSVTSVTQAASFRDYSFVKADWRVVDTPGLGDTNRSAAAVRGELARIARFAPHGVTAFVVVVPRGRFTHEHEAALRELEAIFGAAALRRFAVVALTGAIDPVSEGRQLMTRDALVDEINALPLKHFFRGFLEGAGLRVVPVENRFDPHKQISRMTLHQRVLDVERERELELARGGAAAAAAGGGLRYDLSEFISAGDEEEPAAAAGGAGAAARDPAERLEAALAALPPLRRCTTSVVRREGGGGGAVLRTDCELE